MNKFLYQHIKDYSVAEVFNSAYVGFEFEFLTTKTPEFIIEDLNKVTGKSVSLTSDPRMQPSWTAPVLLKEYEGKTSRYKLILAPQDYMSTETLVPSILEWIRGTSKTNNTTGLVVSLAFNNKELQTNRTISNMDIAKMVLKIDEEYLYNRFPERRGSPFALSVKQLIPLNEFLNVSDPFRSIQNSFRMPVAPYYGIDFTDQTYGILKFNYIGGKGYDSKFKEVNEAIKYYIISTYQALNVPGYTQEMEYKFSKMLENYPKIRRAYFEPEFFMKEFKDIQVGIDLKLSEQFVKTYWPTIRGPLTKLMLESGLKKGKFNFDTEQGVFQIKDTKLTNIKIDNLQIVNSEVQGIIENCSLWHCTVQNSQIRHSTIVSNNKIEGCFISQTRADRTNEIHKSFIRNSGEIINCKVFESVIQNAGIGKEAKLDENCTIVGQREQALPEDNSLKVKEVRDYKWIKTLTPSNSEKGYGNEFKNKW